MTATVRCETCGDSHQMWHSGLDRYVPCTRCPVPCRECAGDEGRGAYCAVVDCSCACHHWLGANEKSVPPPDPPTREALVSLLRRWRVANAEGDDENEALADETDRAIAAEARRPTGDAGPCVRHVARVEIDLESYRRGGSCRTAACACGWRGPERGTLELAADDAIGHERKAREGSA
ncbi:MAG TPA: hypothetical protein VLE97_07310 [Gaiellaceae bacterium]|nr:hypothetical protein [Gaiellaceae bacterium]